MAHFVNLSTYLLSSVTPQFSIYSFQTCASSQEPCLSQHMTLPPTSQRKLGLLRMKSLNILPPCQLSFWGVSCPFRSKSFLWFGESSSHQFRDPGSSYPICLSCLSAYVNMLKSQPSYKNQDRTRLLLDPQYTCSDWFFPLPLRAKLFIKRIVYIHCIHC